MPLDPYIPLISAAISFGGLILVVLQLRDNAKQQTVNSLVGIPRATLVLARQDIPASV